MIAPLIDIPAGLEDAYHRVVSYLGGNNPDTIILRKGSPAKQNFYLFSDRSLFVKWKSIWADFDAPRKLSWSDYWESLPFSPHSGQNGWPGSGYSAFVYINAPRYKANLDLLLDPPVSNLIYNGDFSLGDDGWSFSDWTIHDGYAEIIDAPDTNILNTDGAHEFILPADADVRLQFDYESTDALFLVQIFDTYNSESVFIDFNLDGSGHYDQTFLTTLASPTAIIQFIEYNGGDVLIDNISLVPAN